MSTTRHEAEFETGTPSSSPLHGTITRGAPHVLHKDTDAVWCVRKGELVSPQDLRQHSEIRAGSHAVTAQARSVRDRSEREHVGPWTRIEAPRAFHLHARSSVSTAVPRKRGESHVSDPNHASAGGKKRSRDECRSSGPKTLGSIARSVRDRMPSHARVAFSSRNQRVVAHPTHGSRTATLGNEIPKV